MAKMMFAVGLALIAGTVVADPEWSQAEVGFAIVFERNPQLFIPQLRAMRDIVENDPVPLSLPSESFRFSLPDDGKLN